MVEQQLFREDLFHRLNVIRIKAPALRERAADVPLLLKHFLRNAAAELGCDPKTSTKAMDDYLCSLPWSGNVRQLENLARWLTVMSSGAELEVADLPPDLSPTENPIMDGDGEWVAALQQWARSTMKKESGVAKQATEQFEKTLILCALEQTGNRRQEAAAILGWGRNTLTRKIKEYNLEP